MAERQRIPINILPPHSEPEVTEGSVSKRNIPSMKFEFWAEFYFQNHNINFIYTFHKLNLTNGKCVLPNALYKYTGYLFV